MTTPLFSVPASIDRGLIGERRLVTVQTLGVTRLHGAVVPLVPEGFIVVSGLAPEARSNGCGKTSPFAAISLLLGDPAWTLRTHPAAVAGLLYRPRAGGGADQTDPATEGFIAGLFWTEAAEPLTAWMRLQTAVPHLKVRLAEGCRFAVGESESQRWEEAERVWTSLGSSGELGARNYVERLYGEGPRCLAYVSKRGSLKSSTALLAKDDNWLPPEELGPALIELTGGTQLLDAESQMRQRLALKGRELQSKRRRDDELHEQEEHQLTIMRARARARLLLERADAAWSEHFGRGLLEARRELERLEAERSRREPALIDVQRTIAARKAQLKELCDDGYAPDLAKLERAEEEAAETVLSAREAERKAQETLEAMRARQRELRQIADGHPAGASEQAAAEIGSAEQCLALAADARAVAAARRDDAQAALRAAEKGASAAVGSALEHLREADVPSALLVDELDVDAEHTVGWETRLLPYREAIAVPRAHRDRALQALRGHPGTIVVSGPDTELPRGVARAPVGARALMAVLANRADARGDAIDVEAGVHVSGPPSEASIGRTARVGAARAAVLAAQREMDRRRDDESRAHDALDHAQSEHRRAEAADELHQVDRSLSEHQERLAQATAALPSVRTAAATARKRLANAQERTAKRDSEVSVLKQNIELLKREEQRVQQELASLDKTAADVRIDYWLEGWSADEAAATLAYGSGGRTAVRARNDAAERLKEALRGLGIDRDTGNGADDPQLRIVLRARKGSDTALDPERELVDGRPQSAYPEVAAPLRGWLASYQQEDETLEQAVARDRDQRQLATLRLEDALREQRSMLQTEQDSAIDLVSARLRAVGDRFGELMRGLFGDADLNIEESPPRISDADLEDPQRLDELAQREWVWRVQPRWCREPGGELVSYEEPQNSAQTKVASIYLVLAALLACSDAPGRLLLLDELGDSLDEVNRRDVLTKVAEVARDSRATVLGACQDTSFEDACAHSSQSVWLERGPRERLNYPVRTWAHDACGERVALTLDDVLAGRRAS